MVSQCMKQLRERRLALGVCGTCGVVEVQRYRHCAGCRRRRCELKRLRKVAA